MVLMPQTSIPQKRSVFVLFCLPEEECIYSISLHGKACQKDNGKDMQTLTQLPVDTPAWTWISHFEAQKNGRGAI